MGIVRRGGKVYYSSGGNDWPIAEGVGLGAGVGIEGVTLSKQMHAWTSLGYDIYKDKKGLRWAVMMLGGVYGQFPIDGQDGDPSNPPELDGIVMKAYSSTTSPQAAANPLPPKVSSHQKKAIPPAYPDEEVWRRDGYDIFKEIASAKRWAVRAGPKGWYHRVPLDGQGEYNVKKPVAMDRVRPATTGSKTTDGLIQRLDALEDELDSMRHSSSMLREILAGIALAQGGEYILVESHFLQGKESKVRFGYEAKHDGILIQIEK